MGGLVMFMHRVIKKPILALLLAFSIISCRQDKQLTGMYNVSFQQTAVCDFREQILSFANTSDTPSLIRGAAISLGSNTYGSYDLKSVTVGSQETEIVSGDIKDLTIPPHTNYAFKIRYTPRVENKTEDVAYFDIAYLTPRQGIVQVRLDGSSGNRLTACDQTDGNAPQPVEGLDGTLRFRVTKLVAATSALPSTMDSDQGTSPFGGDLHYVEVPLTLSRSGRSAVLPAIPTSAQLGLPPPGPRAASAVQDLGIQQPTVITTRAEVAGLFDPTTGEITLRNVPVTMDGDFHTEFILDLTTEPRPNNTTPIVNPRALSRLGNLWSDQTQQLRGQRVNSADNNSVVLVGFVKVERVTNAANPELAQLQGKSMAVIIYGNILAGTN